MESAMQKGDRFARALFVALAVGLGWGIRGDFGHVLGAMFPGAALGLGFAYVTGQKSMFKWMPLLGAIGGLGISTGGAMSYGILHGYAKSDTFINYSYGFFTLVLQGSAWGCFGCALLGLALEKDRLKATELVSAVVTVLLAGSAVYFLVVTLLGFHINPPRSDLSIGYTGGVIGLFIWLVLNKKRYGFKGALFGYIGFGLGMAMGRFLANVSYLQTFSINHWNIMEVSCGFIGGFVFTFGMLGKKFPDPPEGEGYPLLSVYSVFYVMTFIPIMHRLLRIRPEEKLQHWANLLESYRYSNPEAFSRGILAAIHVVCFLGFVGAGIWLWLHFRNKHRFAAFPILYFSGLMLLIQNLNALFPFYPYQPRSIRMHLVFWVIYALMIAYAVWGKRPDVTDPDEVAERVNWRKWVAGAVAVYVFIIVMAGFVNGEKTMASANTRWPLWSWRDDLPSR